jgi:plastocyanin
MRRISKFAITSVLALSVFAIGSIAMWSASASSVTKVVKMTNALRYMPMTITVHKGDRIKWRNVSSAGLQHTSTSKAWNSGALNPGQSFTRRFSALGTFKYHCRFHGSQGMIGTIKVVA